MNWKKLRRNYPRPTRDTRLCVKVKCVHSHSTVNKSIMVSAASAHLLSERDRTEEKIKQLMEERDLIDKHLSDQQSKQQEVGFQWIVKMT
jgi:aspartate/methionine/tyrosine aminotransferase